MLVGAARRGDPWAIRELVRQNGRRRLSALLYREVLAPSARLQPALSDQGTAPAATSPTSLEANRFTAKSVVGAGEDTRACDGSDWRRSASSRQAERPRIARSIGADVGR